MRFLDVLFGRPLATREEKEQEIGPLAGLPILGLDAVSSAAYGPEAALTLLLPLGAAGLSYIVPISALIIVILLIVYFSYRQTIAAYPQGGGSYTVAKENLGPHAALLAAAALALDYVLTVAVGIAAGVGALVSAAPALLPHTLALCLSVLAILTIINLRGIRESGRVFMLPTYAFIGTLSVVIVAGTIKAILSGGHPVAVIAPPILTTSVKAISAWILLRAFASGCTAMTGVEAVSNGVPLFREPAVREAQRTLTIIIAVLIFLLAGIAGLACAYGIAATPPGQAGYQSILSMLVAAVFGRGFFYYATMASIVSVLALSANTSFADFPRLCRILANDRYLPGAFVSRGRRLVFSWGIITLSMLSAALLIAFGGITDRLIPLYAIGAFLAFTLSQTGMVQHWRRNPGPDSGRFMLINGLGALATGITLVVVAISKFAEGAWITVIVIPLLLWFFARINRHYRKIEEQISTFAPLELPEPQNPIVVVAAGTWSKITQHGLKIALRLSNDVYVVQVKTERDNIENLADNWRLLIENPARAAGIASPKRVILKSDYREFFKPFVDFILKLEQDNPGRDVFVVIPDLVMGHWYDGFLHNNRGAVLRTMLRMHCGSQVSIIDALFQIHS